MNRWSWLLGRMARQLWVRASLYGLLGIASALVAAGVGPFIPAELASRVGAGSVETILSIVASSMLTVATFSLGIMVSATGAAASGATPRASSLLAEDAAAQSAMSTFLGAFLFSLVGIIGLSAGIYGAGGQLVLFAATLVMIALVVLTLMHWLHHLTRLGRVGEVIDRVEAVAGRAMAAYAADPLMGCRPLDPEAPLPPGAVAIECGTIGYLQHVDVAGLAAIAEQNDMDLIVNLRPGAFVTPDRPPAYGLGPVDDAMAARIIRCFTIGDARSFDQDPRFGLVVLAEIASRALTPAVNDPGTAIDVLGTLLRVLQPCLAPTIAEPIRPRLAMAAMAPADMLDDAFAPIARDGAAMVEVAMRLQKILASLARSGEPAMAEAARQQAREAMERALEALPHNGDRRRLRAERNFTDS